MPFQGHRVQVRNTPDIYLVLDNQSCWIPDEQTYRNLFGSDGDVDVLSQSQFNTIPSGQPLSHGAILMKGDRSDDVYLLTGGQKRWINSPPVIDKYHFDRSGVQVCPQILVDCIQSGPDVV